MNALWMLGACLLFATMGACVKLAGGHFNLGQTVLVRGLVPVVMLLAWVVLFRLSLQSRHWKSHLYRSLFGSLGMLLYFSAIARLPLAAAVTLNNTSALFMAAAVTLRQRHMPPLPVLGALIMGFVGVAMVLQPTITPEQWLGGVLGISSGLLGCLAQLNVRELSRAGEPEWRTVLFFSAACTLFSLPLAICLPGGSPAQADSAQWASLLAVGVAGCIGQLAMTRAYGQGKTIVTASLSYTTVIFSSLFGVFLWGDHLSAVSYLGISLIATASIISSHPAVWARHNARHGDKD